MFFIANLPAVFHAGKSIFMGQKLLVVVATFPEIAPVLAHFNLEHKDYLETENFDILFTGVGMTATAFALGCHFSRTQEQVVRYEAVLNVGIAGSFDPSLALGSIVQVTNDTFSELGAEDNEHFLSLPEMGFGENRFEAADDKGIPHFNNLPKVRAITVNRVHGNTHSIAHVRELFNPQVESMEGAAVFFACKQLHVPAMQVRGISNYVEPRNKAAWNIELAIRNLNNWLLDYLTAL